MFLNYKIYLIKVLFVCLRSRRNMSYQVDRNQRHDYLSDCLICFNSIKDMYLRHALHNGSDNFLDKQELVIISEKFTLKVYLDNNCFIVRNSRMENNKIQYLLVLRLHIPWLLSWIWAVHWSHFVQVWYTFKNPSFKN